MWILLALFAADWREWNAKGLAAQKAGSYTEAAQAFEAGLREAGTDRVARAQLGNNLGAAYYSTGRVEAASQAYTGALADWDAVSGPSADAAICRLNFAVLLRGTGRLPEARRHAEAGTAGLVRAGVTGPRLASAYQTRAEIARMEGRFGEAEHHLRAASAALEREPDPVLSAQIFQTEGTLWQDRGEPERAVPLHQAALELLGRTAGPEHPHTASARVALGHALFGCGRLDEAQTELEQGLAATERAFGPAHPRVGVAANNLAQLYLAQGLLAAAEPLYRRALDIHWTNSAGSGDVAKVMANLGDLFVAQGKARGAESLYRQAAEIAERGLGGTHPHTVAILEKWIRLLERQKRGTELRRVRARLGPQTLN